mgnify:FL=1
MNVSSHIPSLVSRTLVRPAEILAASAIRQARLVVRRSVAIAHGSMSARDVARAIAAVSFRRLVPCRSWLESISISSCRRGSACISCHDFAQTSPPQAA